MDSAGARVRFYFSFRSPYSWFAFRRIEEALSGLPVILDYIPVFPPKDFRDIRANPEKSAYINEDVARFAAAYGLGITVPEPYDTDWMRPHAGFLMAQDQGAGRGFALAIYALRFSRGRDVSGSDAMAAAARTAGLEASTVLDAADDAEFHKRVLLGMNRAREDGLFGVPFFVYRGQKFWGNDRIEWLARAIACGSGRPGPDPSRNPPAVPGGNGDHPIAWGETRR